MVPELHASPLQVQLKRVREPPSPEDGVRVLVERRWPRGLKKEEAHIHRWPKGLAPSESLRRWFGHEAERWQEFQVRYRKELLSPEQQPLLEELMAEAIRRPVTLLFSAKGREQNSALVLKEALEEFFRLRTEEGLARFDTLAYIAARLRSPQGGCPWDLAQTHDSLKRYLLEETYEAFEAIEAAQAQMLCEELGDILLQVALHAQLASEASHFTVSDVLRSINTKLVRRHPHVFGDTSASTLREVEQNWEAIKQEEKGSPSVLTGIPKSMPALAHSQAIQHRAARMGFEWKELNGVWEKVKEEQEELRRAETKKAQEHELGDLFIALVNIARWLDLDAESAVRKANQRFSHRFTTMERFSRERGLEFKTLTLEQMDGLWEEAKAMEKT